MPQHLITYSVVKALYDRGLDYIDAFWPFVLEVLPRDRRAISLSELQEAIDQRFGLRIPQHALTTICRRAKKRGFVSIPGGRLSVTQLGVNQVESLETEREVQRRINEMLEDARSYLAQHHSEILSRDQTRMAIDKLISNNLLAFSPVLGGGQLAAPSPSDDSLDRLDLLIVEYFQHVEEANARVFRTLSDLVAGSILASALNTDSFAEGGLRFEDTNVYIDTNFAFSALELGYEEVNRPAKELLSLLRDARVFRISIFDFTVAEAIALLQNYETEYRSYVPGVKVNHIFSSLRTRGWTPADVREFTAGIEEMLNARNIHVVTTGIRLRDYTPEAEAVSVLARYKPDQGAWGQNHDLAAIELVEKLRRKKARRIQQAKEIFLTSDFRLARYAFVERGHRDNGTISEVIPDRLLTNLIWLKSPDLISNLSLDSFISMHSGELLIDREVWQNFYRSVRSLRESGNLDQRDVDVLLYDRHVLDALRIVPPQSAAGVDEQFVLGSLEAAEESVRAESEANAIRAANLAREELQHEHERKLDEREVKTLEITAERDRLLAEDEARRKKRSHRRAEAEKKLRRAARDRARLYVRGIQCIVGAIFVIALVVVGRAVLTRWDQVEPLIALLGVFVSVLIALFGFKFDPLGFWNGIEQFFEQRVYEGKVNEVWLLFEEQ